MGMMTHDEIIKWLGYHKQGEIGKAAESIDLAIYTIEQYRKLQAEYNARLKADMMAMLKEIQTEIEEIDNPKYKKICNTPYKVGKVDCLDIIQEKINALKELNCSEIPTGSTTKNDLGVDCISRKAVQTRLKEIINEMETIFADIREREVNDSVCGLCEYDCDHGLDGFANECPGFEKDDCFKLNEKYKAEWLDISNLPSVTPQERKGHWIGHREHCENLGVMPSGLGAYEWCSNCDCGIDVREWHRNHYNYCPNCGCKMVEPQEVEK